MATKVATKFNIKSDACAEKHVNVVNNYLKGSSGDAKTGKILEQLQPKKQKLSSVAELYNENLELIAKGVLS